TGALVIVDRGVDREVVKQVAPGPDQAAEVGVACADGSGGNRASAVLPIREQPGWQLRREGNIDRAVALDHVVAALAEDLVVTAAAGDVVVAGVAVDQRDLEVAPEG